MGTPHLTIRAGHLVASLEELEDALDRIQGKGGVESKIKDGSACYCNAPLVVGIYEYQLGRLSPEFVKDFNQYTSNFKFGLELLSTELPQMRTIPVNRSISPHHRVSTYDEAATLLQVAQGPFLIMECICRKKKTLEGETCKVTDRKETCLAIGDLARPLAKDGVGREISREEAIAIIDQNQRDGLVLQPSNTREVDFICSCCGCCCGMLRMQQRLPRPVDFWASNYQARVDTTTCTGCGKCVRQCQVGAVRVSAQERPAVVDLNRCIGCGVCVPACPTGSISLFRKAAQVKPPKTREDLYNIIMANKKGRLGKAKLVGKLVVDAVRTRQMHLFTSQSE